MIGHHQDIPNRHLLKDRKVIDEINRHLWIESEKAGFDIGFERAAEDWLIKFSSAWINYHHPKRKTAPKIKIPARKYVVKRHGVARSKAGRRKACR